MVISARFDFAGTFSEGRAPILDGTKMGYIDRTGAVVIPAIFDNAHAFSHGLAYVTIDRTEGYIDPTGHFVWQSA